MLITSGTKLRGLANTVNNRSMNQKHFVKLEISRCCSSHLHFKSTIMVVVAIRLLVFVDFKQKSGCRDSLPGGHMVKTRVTDHLISQNWWLPKLTMLMLKHQQSIRWWSNYFPYFQHCSQYLEPKPAHTCFFFLKYLLFIYLAALGLGCSVGSIFFFFHLWHAGSTSPARDWTGGLVLGARGLNHWTREDTQHLFLYDPWAMRGVKKSKKIFHDMWITWNSDFRVHK